MTIAQAKFSALCQALAIHVALGDALQGSRIIAGYFAGELAAWCVAGLIEPVRTLDLIVQRADAMDALSSSDDGLLFIGGLERPSIDMICSKYDVEIAIVNPADAYVLGGTGDHLAAVMEEARAKGAERLVRLAVKVASHTKILTHASVQFRTLLK